MSILAIDYGDKRIGLAISRSGFLATPLSIFEAESDQAKIDRLRTIMAEEKVGQVVIGLPLLKSGEEGYQAKKVRRFARQLRRAIDCPIDFVDETLTTAQVSENAKANRQVDDLAAQVILEQYLNEIPNPKFQIPK